MIHWLNTLTEFQFSLVFIFTMCATLGLAFYLMFKINKW